MNNEQARRHIQRGAREPQYRQSAAYRAAMRHTTAHYRGMEAAARDQQAMGSGGSSSSTKRSCALLTVFAAVMCSGWPVAAAQAISGWSL